VVLHAELHPRVHRPASPACAGLHAMPAASSASST
jgi:hypothetical protein